MKPNDNVETWRAVVEAVRTDRPALASVLEHALPIEMTRERVVLGFETSALFLASRATEPEALEITTRALRAHFHHPTEVVVDLSAKLVVPGDLRTVAAVDAQTRATELAKARAVVERHPVVQEAMRLFGAHLRDVKLPSGEG